jgi:hypothetical protein
MRSSQLKDGAKSAERHSMILASYGECKTMQDVRVITDLIFYPGYSSTFAGDVYNKEILKELRS